MKYIVCSLLVLFLCACGNNKKSIASMLSEWQGKEIVFQGRPIFTQGKDTVDYLKQTKYKILVYTDSIGCVGCKLRLEDWRKFIAHTKTVTNEPVQFLFFFSKLSPEKVNNILKDYQFEIPVCVDIRDSIGILNDFPEDFRYQTFLLDDKNKVLIVGNPIYNPKIGQLISDILKSQDIKMGQYKEKTLVRLNSNVLNFGKLLSGELRKGQIVIQNIGNVPLVVDDIITSCGCVTVEYDKNPVFPNKNLILNISYQSERSGYFEKTITVYCNTVVSPIMIKIRGKSK